MKMFECILWHYGNLLILMARIVKFKCNFNSYSLFFRLVGVMAARGIMRNPAMYAGYDETPHQCIQDWVSLLL